MNKPEITGGPIWKNKSLCPYPSYTLPLVWVSSKVAGSQGLGCTCFIWWMLSGSRSEGRGNLDRAGENNNVRCITKDLPRAAGNHFHAYRMPPIVVHLKDRRLSPPPFIYPPAPSLHCLRDPPRSVNITPLLFCPAWPSKLQWAQGGPKAERRKTDMQPGWVWNCPHSCSRFAGRGCDSQT